MNDLAWDITHLLKVQKFHNTRAMRDFRASNGDTDKACACDFCRYLTNLLEECNAFK